jgi:glycogen(starch) synthase
MTRVAVLAYTQIDRDSRVLRACDALAEAGFAVTAVGFGQRPSPRWNFVALPQMGGLPLQRLALLATQAPANLAPALAPRLHFLRAHHRAARAALVALAPDVIHANDWIALPAAVAAARATGARLVYDSHEFAAEEHADNLRWRLVAQASARATEARLIGAAAAVITVSDGIADALARAHALPAHPAVVRNAPGFEEVAPSDDVWPRRLLFHGVLKPGRGVEAAIAATAALPDHVLTLRGEGAPAYLAALRAQAQAAQGRVRFEAAVAPGEVVRAAAAAQIGLFCAPLDTGHNRFAMPNKFFEYAMAGLATVAARGSELGALIERLGCGALAADATPQALAACLSGVDDAALARMRAAARAAARRMCWEREKQALIDVYAGLARR